MKKKLTIALLAALALGACSEQEMNDNQGKNGQQITFVPTVATDWNGAQPTRGTVLQTASRELESDFSRPLYLHTVTTAGFMDDSDAATVTRGTQVSAITEFSVSGYCYNKDGNQTVSDVQPNFLDDQKVEYDNNTGQWKSSQQFYWPLSGYALDFYAYSPTDAATVSTGNGPLLLTYAVNTEDITAQADLLTAKAVDQAFSKDATVNLEFGHALTAVQFVLGTDIVPGTITSITIEDVYTSGTLNVGTGAWTLTDTSDFTISLNNHDTSVSDVLTGNKTLLMIPQTFTITQNCNPRIVVTVNDGSQNYSLACSLDNTSWAAGTTVTYKISTSSLNVMTMGAVTFPTTWGTGDNSTTYPIKSGYVSGDTIGVYAVDGGGKVINANVKYRYNGTTWVKDDTQTTFYPASYTFYAYYPYRASLTGAPTKGSIVLVSNSLPTATQFFAAARSAWTPADNQGTETLINNQDLQYAQGVVTNGTTVDFTMTHACELVSMQLLQTTVTNTQYYLYYDTNYRWNDINTTQVTASSTFSGFTPLSNDDKYYYVVRGSKNLSATGDDTWTLPVDGNANTYEAFQIRGARGDRGFIVTERYVVAVGDIIYTDGAISHTNGNTVNLISGKTPAAIVYKVYTTTSTDDNYVAGYHNGLAMGLNDVATNRQWYTNTTADQNNTTFPNLTSQVTSAYATSLTNIAADRNGYTKYNALKASADNDAFSAVRDLQTTIDRCYWFLPAIGNFYDATVAFGAQPSAAVGHSSSGNYVASNNQATTVSNAMDTYIRNRVGNSYFTAIGHTTSTSSVHFWSSSEFSATAGAAYHFDASDDFAYHSHTKTSTFRVRPFLAF